MSSDRDLMRRWYGQIRNRDNIVLANCIKYYGHTVLYDSTAGLQSIVPYDSVIDMVYRIAHKGGKYIPMVYGYKASYSEAKHMVNITVANRVFTRSLGVKPGVSVKDSINYRNGEFEILRNALDIDHHIACMQHKNSVIKPTKPNFVFLASVSKDLDPKEYTTWSDIDALKQLCLVDNFIRSPNCGYEGIVTVKNKCIELKSLKPHCYSDLVYSIPMGGKIAVNDGDIVGSDHVLIKLNYEPTVYTVKEVITNNLIINYGDLKLVPLTMISCGKYVMSLYRYLFHTDITRYLYNWGDFTKPKPQPGCYRVSAWVNDKLTSISSCLRIQFN